MAKLQYWAFLSVEEDYSNPRAYTLRVSFHKYYTPEEACKDAFGYIMPTLLAKSLGGNKRKNLKLIKSKPTKDNLNGWLKYPWKL